MRRILNNRHNQLIKIAQTPLLPFTLPNPLNLLQMLNLKCRIFSKVLLYEERDEDGPLRVRVDGAAGAAVEGGEEEGRTS
jgi:hypothetical protein